ncbi:MAG TPA: ROK family protein [Acidimicrobiia bacterium]|nr:ROK family protein [Acidimicrobiia bacterium]
MQITRDLLRVFWDGQIVDRAELGRQTGVARSTVSSIVGGLLTAGLIEEVGTGESTGGRPPQLLRLNSRRGVVLGADLGATHGRLLVADLAGVSLAEGEWPLDMADGPHRVVAWMIDRFEDLLKETGYSEADVYGVALGVPGPVEFSEGWAVAPPIMPGWDKVPLRPLIQEHVDAPVVVDNDVNVMAYGEYWTQWRHRAENLLFVKVGTGIGSGIIASGRVYRGSQGAAGDIGHVALTDHLHVICPCGNRGCLEAVAGGKALTERLVPGRTVRDLVEMAQKGEADVIPALREAGRTIGQVVAGAVNLFNPSVLAIGGGLGVVGDHVITGIKEVVFQRSTVLATRDLRLVPSRLGNRAGVVGAATLAIARAFDSPRVWAQLELG